MRTVLLMATAVAAISCGQGAMADTITFSGNYADSNESGTGTFDGSFTLIPADVTDYYGQQAWQITAGFVSTTGAIAMMFDPDVDPSDAVSEFYQWSDDAGGLYEQVQLTDTNGYTFSLQVHIPNGPNPYTTYSALVGSFTGDSIDSDSGYSSSDGSVFSIDSITLTSVDVPEPASILVLSAGLAGLAGLRRKRLAG